MTRTNQIAESFLAKFHQENQNMTKSVSTSLYLANNKLSGSMDSLNTLKPVNNQDETKSIIDESLELPPSNSSENQTSNSGQQAPYQPVKSAHKSLGSFYDNASKAPVVYAVRLLSYKFLLNMNYNDDSLNNPNSTKLKPDSEVKVIVKSVALDCCSYLIGLCPYLLFKPVIDDLPETSPNNTLHIYDLINYVNHTDDKMRTNTCLLIGQLINTVLLESSGSSTYNQWLVRMLNRPAVTNSKNVDFVAQFLRMESLISYVLQFVRTDSTNTNNMCKRFAVSSLHTFLPTLFRTRHACTALDILVSLVHLKNSSYNLVKCELVDLIASIDFKNVAFIENNIVALVDKRRRSRKRKYVPEEDASV
jgi:hypothetical protein